MERFNRWFARWLASPLHGTTSDRWRRLRAAGDLPVDPAYRGRAAMTLLCSLMNSRNARRERRRFGERIDAARVEAPVFILGHYRSGTTHLHNLLASDPRLGFANYYQVSFPHTFLTTERTGARLGSFLMMSRRPQDRVALGMDVPAEDELALCSDTFLSPHMGWHFPRAERRYRRYLTLAEATPDERAAWKASLARFARKLTLVHDGRPLVFKSPLHTARIALLLEAFPDARFVHLHRDPYTIYQSTRHMELTVPPLFQYQRRALGDLGDVGDVDEQILWRMRETYRAYLADREAIPAGRLVDVPYVELKRDPLGTLRRVYDSLDLPPFDGTRETVERYLAGIRGYRNNRYETIAPTIRERIAAAWAPYIDAFGYAATAVPQVAAVPRPDAANA